MADVGGDTKTEGSRLRERAPKPLHLDNAQNAKEKVLQLNSAEESKVKNEKDRRTYGRTPDGTGRFTLAPPATAKGSLKSEMEQRLVSNTVVSIDDQCKQLLTS